MKPIHVRAAIPADAEAILRVHHAAVHKTAAAYYPPEVLDAGGAKLTEEIMKESGERQRMKE